MLKNIVIAMVLVQLASCGGSGSRNEKPVSDPQYCSSFVVQNNSNYLLTVEFNAEAGYGENETVAVAAGDTQELTTRCSIGSTFELAPNPQEVFALFEVHLPDEENALVYSETSDDHWTKAEVMGYAEHVLSLADDDFQF